MKLHDALLEKENGCQNKRKIHYHVAIIRTLEKERGTGENVYPMKTAPSTMFSNCLCELGQVTLEGESLSSGWVFKNPLQKSLPEMKSNVHGTRP